MITSILVENFKSIDKLRLDLGNLSVFIGPNNAGKTNILDVFGFLKRHVSQHSSPSSQILSGGDPTRNLNIELTGASTQGASESYRYAVSFSDQFGHLVVISEVFEVVEESARKILFGVKAINSKINIATPFPGIPNELGRHPRRLALSSTVEQLMAYLPGHSQRTALQKYLHPLLVAYKDISGFARFNFDPSRMRDPGQVKEQFTPNELGDNIPQVLHSLHSKNRRSSFDIIEEQLRAIVPEITELVSDLQDINTSIAIREDDSSRLVSSQSMPDGVLKLVALLVILNLPEKAPFIAIEEPENYIHPYAQNAVAGLLSAYAEDHQLAITTHSPYFLSNFDLKDIFIVGRTGGYTTASRPRDLDDLRKRLLEAGMTVGDAWYAGHLSEAK